MTARDLLEKWECVIRDEARRQARGGVQLDPTTMGEYFIEAVHLHFRSDQRGVKEHRAWLEGRKAQLEAIKTKRIKRRLALMERAS